MKYLLTILCLTINVFVFAQGKQTPDVITKQVHTGKATLITDNNAGGWYAEPHDSSGMIMFEYNYKSAQNDAIADDELTEIFIFNIKPDRTGKFLIKDDQIRLAQGHLYRSCFCIDRGVHLVTSGTIRGAKMTKTTWYINANIVVKIKQGDSERLVTKKIKGYFTILP